MGVCGAIIVILFLLVLSSILWSTYRNGISPMPTSRQVRRALWNALPKCNGPIYELGSGWGHLLILLAKKYPHAKIVGYETSWVPYFVSRIVTLTFYTITVSRKDFFKEDLSQASLFVCYLYPGAMKKLRDVEVPLITHTFALPGREISHCIEAKDIYRTKIMVYN